MIDKKEIQEARDVAREVLTLLNEVEKHLKSARNWGYYDMLGGGFLTSLIKHGKIDKAEVLLNKVRNKLNQLQQELGDVDLDLVPQVDISGFTRFMDIAFDNIVFDWMTQSKIQESLKDVANIAAEVARIISILNQIEHKYS